MAGKFKAGDHATWSSEAGHVAGTITKVYTRDVDHNADTHHAQGCGAEKIERLMRSSAQYEWLSQSLLASTSLSACSRDVGCASVWS